MHDTLVDEFTRQGMDRVDRGLRAAGSLTGIGNAIGVLGVLAVLGLIVGAATTDDAAEETAAYIGWAVVIAFQTVVVVAVFRALGSIVELLAGHYEVGLLETLDDEDEA